MRWLTGLQLVDAQTVLHPVPSSQLTVTQTLRVIKKGFHHDFRTRIGIIINTLLEGRSSVAVSDGTIGQNRLLSWVLQPRTPLSTKSGLEDPRKINIYHGPPRVLEVGCSDGNLCFRIKERHPDWYGKILALPFATLDVRASQYLPYFGWLQCFLSYETMGRS